MMSNKIGKTKLLLNLGLMAVMTGATVYAAYRVSEGPLGLGSKATNNSAILSANTMNEEVMVNELFEVQIYMLPEGNQVGGVDAVLTYEPTFIEPVTVVKDIASPFAGFVANIDAQRGRIEMNSVVYQNGQMGGWVTEPAAIAKVTFKARVMTNPTTLIGFDYEQGRTTDSNVAVVFEGEVVDALLDQPKELQIAIVSRPEPTIAPTATPTPTVKLVPTSTPRVVPTLAPTPTLRLTPTVQPTPTLVPEEIVVHRAQMEGKLLWRRLVVVATDSLAPEAFLTVYDHSNSTEIGVLRYNKFNNSYGGEFSVKTRIRKIRVESHYGNSVVAEVQK